MVKSLPFLLEGGGRIISVERFGKPIVKTGKPTRKDYCNLKTKQEFTFNDSKIRTLRPNEYEALRTGPPKESEVIQMDTLLLTGMRYVELQRFHGRPEWFDGNFVFLPREAVLKQERKQAERWVRLSRLGKQTVPKFFGVKNLPTPETWRENLQRWAVKVGLDPIGLGPKTSRKTWESWAVWTYHEERLTEITMSQGHTSVTSLKYYLNMPFLEADKEAMKPWVEGMF